MGLWADGFWADGFWAAGFWAGLEAPAPLVTKPLWFEYAQALRHPDIRELQPRLLINENEVRKRVLREAQGNATWARYAYGAPKGDLNIEVYVELAVTNELEPT